MVRIAVMESSDVTRPALEGAQPDRKGRGTGQRFGLCFSGASPCGFARLLEHPPADGSQEDQEFLQLLHDIELFHPTALSAPPDTNFAKLGRDAQALMARANDFQAKREAREKQEKWMTFPEDGEGIGPTTGV